MSSTSFSDKDVESASHGSLTVNNTVSSLSWSSVTVHAKDAKTKQPKVILNEVSGIAKPGQLVALMGPSGSGKTTLLNVLAHRAAAASARVDANILVNGSKQSLQTFRDISSYVEQEDALIGSLTVRQTLDFAARLALPSTILATDRRELVERLIESFGLKDNASTLIGTPIAKGISGGQKRRVSVACQLVASPKILFLDEPTSGLDSTASYEVMAFIKEASIKYNLIVIASIHQPSTKTFNLFDNLILLSQGTVSYQGPVVNVDSYFGSIGYPIPAQMNPAEHILDLTNTDFAVQSDTTAAQLKVVQDSWSASAEFHRLKLDLRALEVDVRASKTNIVLEDQARNQAKLLLTLMHRSLIKSYRDVTVYGIRIIMYAGLAIMVGTVWLRLDTTQENIQPFINAIFFGSAFMSFMAVAYVPAFLEDRAVFVKERANGLYGAVVFQLSNFIVGVPWLFVISSLFSLIAYWLVNFQPTATAFFTWIMWVFLDLLAAESLVVLMSSLVPNFVIALALTAFANGLWMGVGGFLVPPTVLNVFWEYVFHYIDYQSYVFQGMMVNEFAARNYDCATGCNCSIKSSLMPECQIAGDAVLQQYGYAQGRTGKWVGILLAIVAVYRLLAWAVTHFRKT